MTATPLEFSLIFFTMMGIIYSLGDTYQDFRHGQFGNALGQLINTMGDTMLLGSQAGRLIKKRVEQSIAREIISTSISSETELAMVQMTMSELSLVELGLMYCAPWGILAITVIMIGSLLISMLDDDRLTAWAKHGPFGKNRRWRFTDQYALWQIAGNEKYACQALMNVVMSPKIGRISTQYLADKTVYIVEVILQQFYPGDDTLELYGQWEIAQLGAYPDFIGAWQQGPQAIPYKIIQMMSKATMPRVTKMHYYFCDQPILPKNKMLPEIRLRLHIKARLILSAGKFILPCHEFPTAKDDQLSSEKTVIDDNDPGWVTAIGP